MHRRDSIIFRRIAVMLMSTFYNLDLKIRANSSENCGVFT